MKSLNLFAIFTLLISQVTYAVGDLPQSVNYKCSQNIDLTVYFLNLEDADSSVLLENVFPPSGSKMTPTSGAYYKVVCPSSVTNRQTAICLKTRISPISKVLNEIEGAIVIDKDTLRKASIDVWPNLEHPANNIQKFEYQRILKNQKPQKIQCEFESTTTG